MPLCNQDRIVSAACKKKNKMVIAASFNYTVHCLNIFFSFPKKLDTSLILSLCLPQLDEDAMASMLADFVACPPDDEDGASGSNQS